MFVKLCLLKCKCVLKKANHSVFLGDSPQNNENFFCEISEDKIAVCEKTAGLRCGKFSDLNSACSKVLVPIKMFQFQDMLNENRFLGTFRGHSKRPICMFWYKSKVLHLYWVSLSVLNCFFQKSSNGCVGNQTRASS